jgi:hypothetical protein
VGLDGADVEPPPYKHREAEKEEAEEEAEEEEKVRFEVLFQGMV